MANSDTLLLWVIYLQFAFFLLPGIAWLVDTAIHRRTRPPEAWAGRRLRSHRSRFESYRRNVGGRGADARGGLKHA